MSVKQIEDIKTVVMKKEKLITALVLIAVFSTGAVYSQSDNWELKKDKNGITIYTHRVTGTNIIEIKASFTVNAPKVVMTSILRNVDDYSEWMSGIFKKIQKVKSINRDEWYIYYEVSVPWPFENRDIVMYVKTMENGDADILKLTCTPSYCSEKTGVVRVKEAEGQWTFTATSSGQTKVTYRFYGDPKTSVPTWLMDKLIVEGSYNTMANLRKVAQKKKSCKM